VQGFLRLIAEHVSRLEGEIEWQRARSDQLEHRGSAAQEATYKRLSRAFMDAVARADRAATRVRIAAEEESKVRVDAAREEAARTIIAGQEEADRILSAARDEAAWLTEQAKEAVGLHPSRPRMEVMTPTGSSELDLEEFDLQFDASLFDLP
jgi:cell division septum initiation protein DivIVA